MSCSEDDHAETQCQETQVECLGDELEVTEDDDDDDAPKEWGCLYPQVGNTSVSISLLKDTVTFGRHHSNDHAFPDKNHVSNFHCTISRVLAPVVDTRGGSKGGDAGRAGAAVVASAAGEHIAREGSRECASFFCTDLKSTNGTLVNELSLKTVPGRRCAIKHDDIIRLGSLATAFKFHDCSTANQGQEGSAIYITQNKLGEGTSGAVYKGIHRETGQEVAIKKISKQALLKGNTRNNSSTAAVTTTVRTMAGEVKEAQILQELDHPNIVKVHDVIDYAGAEEVQIIMWYGSGGDLFDHVKARTDGRLPEEEARRIFRQLLQGVAYLHTQGITHRDLKLENILLGGPAAGSVKIADFGLAVRRHTGDEATVPAATATAAANYGTPEYQAPEIIQPQAGGDASAVDLWALGVILYRCLCGVAPFSDAAGWHDRPYSMTQQILQGHLKFPAAHWGGVTGACKDLVKRLLTVDAGARISAADALEHEWLAVAEPLAQCDQPALRQETTAALNPSGKRPREDGVTAGLEGSSRRKKT